MTMPLQSPGLIVSLFIRLAATSTRRLQSGTRWKISLRSAVGKGAWTFLRQRFSTAFKRDWNSSLDRPGIPHSIILGNTSEVAGIRPNLWRVGL